MATTEKVKRSLIAHFLDTSDKMGEYSAANWARVGKNVTSAAIDFGAQTETEQDIISSSATTELTGYQPNMSVSQQCTKGDPVYTFITKKRRARAILADAHAWMLNVDLWDVTGDGASATYVAEVQEVSIQLDSYGGDGDATPTQEFTINYVGDPIPGTVKITDGAPAFTADVAV